MKICLLTALNERPHISRIMLMCYNRIWNATGQTLHAIAVCSTGEDASLCNSFSVPVLVTPNTSAGFKWNSVLNEALKNESFTHFIILGDDDSLSTEGYRLLYRAAAQGIDYAGFKKNYFVDTETDSAYMHTQPFAANKLIGAGCIISRKAIMACIDQVSIVVKRSYKDAQWMLNEGQRMFVTRSVGEYLAGYGFAKIEGGKRVDLWPNKGNGLDHAREMKLVLSGFPPVAVDGSEVHITDFKSANNIWPYDRCREKWRGQDVQKESAMWFMSDLEKEYIYSLKKVK